MYVGASKKGTAGDNFLKGVVRKDGFGDNNAGNALTPARGDEQKPAGSTSSSTTLFMKQVPNKPCHRSACWLAVKKCCLGDGLSADMPESSRSLRRQRRHSSRPK